MKIVPDNLAYWYLRLNGFLTTVNFVVHPDTRGSQRTDVDVIGVRFPFRSELILKPIEDDSILTRTRSKPSVVIAEVKTRYCDLNGPWTNPNDENMERVVRSIGIVPIEDVVAVATSLYESGVWESDHFLLSLMCFGREENDSLADRYPMVPQITWSRVTEFIFDRFQCYERQKASHPQWDKNGRNLWGLFIESADPKEMLAGIELITGQ